MLLFCFALFSVENKFFFFFFLLFDYLILEVFEDPVHLYISGYGRGNKCR